MYKEGGTCSDSISLIEGKTENVIGGIFPELLLCSISVVSVIIVLT